MAIRGETKDERKGGTAEWSGKCHVLLYYRMRSRRTIHRYCRCRLEVRVGDTDFALAHRRAEQVERQAGRVVDD